MCRRIFQSQTQLAGQIPFYKIGTFGGKADAYIPRELYEQFKQLYPYPKAGDVLISAAGTVGRTVVFDGKDAYFQDSNIVWLDVDRDKVDTAFLYYFYRTHSWRNLEGTTISRLYNSIILDTEIHLPSLAEQRRIAITLKSFDTHIENLSALIEKKRAVRDGALEDLVNGRMVLNELGEKWIEKPLCQIASYRTERASTDRKFYVSTKNMRQNFLGIIPYHDATTAYGTAFDVGDILFGNIRPYLKKIWFADFPGSCSADVLVIRASEDCVPQFLYYLLANDKFISYIMAGGVKGIKMPRGDKEHIMKYPVLLPDNMDDQKMIASGLYAMDREITALEEERDKIAQIREGAMDDLLTGRVRLKV